MSQIRLTYAGKSTIYHPFFVYDDESGLFLGLVYQSLNAWHHLSDGYSSDIAEGGYNSKEEAGAALRELVLV